LDSGNNRLIGNLIYRNKYRGIEIYRSADIRGNTIVYNSTYGIGDSGTDSNIIGNILWGNTAGSFYGTFNKVNFNCIQEGFPVTGNISADPCFVNKDANDYHLKNTSPCINAGDPCFNSLTEEDIDGQDRVIDGNSDGILRIDMGADEFCPFDLSQDGFVDWLDFAVFAQSWRKSQGQAGYDGRCDFYKDAKIDFKDLWLFCAYWLE
jgi:parallel beta-helix repeat protein